MSTYPAHGGSARAAPVSDGLDGGHRWSPPDESFSGRYTAETASRCRQVSRQSTICLLMHRFFWPPVVGRQLEASMVRAGDGNFCAIWTEKGVGGGEKFPRIRGGRTFSADRACCAAASARFRWAAKKGSGGERRGRAGLSSIVVDAPAARGRDACTDVLRHTTLPAHRSAAGFCRHGGRSAAGYREDFVPEVPEKRNIFSRIAEPAPQAEEFSRRATLKMSQRRSMPRTHTTPTL